MMAGPLDFLSQQQPYLGGLSLAEMLSIPAATFGGNLAQRGGRIGGPLGLGLASLGGIGNILAQRAGQTQQAKANAQMIRSLKGSGVAPDSVIEQAAAGVEQGGDPSQFDKMYDAFKQKQQQPKFETIQTGTDAKTGKPTFAEWDPGSGQIKAMPAGSSPYVAPKEATPKTLTPEQQAVAGSLGLPDDMSQWKQDDYTRFNAASAKQKLAGEKPERPDKANYDFLPDGKGGVIAVNKSDPTDRRPVPGVAAKGGGAGKKLSPTMLQGMAKSAHTNADKTYGGYGIGGLKAGGDSEASKSAALDEMTQKLTLAGYDEDTASMVAQAYVDREYGSAVTGGGKPSAPTKPPPPGFK